MPCVGFMSISGHHKAGRVLPALVVSVSCCVWVKFTSVDVLSSLLPRPKKQDSLFSRHNIAGNGILDNLHTYARTERGIATCDK